MPSLDQNLSALVDHVFSSDDSEALDFRQDDPAFYARRTPIMTTATIMHHDRVIEVITLPDGYHPNWLKDQAALAIQDAWETLGAECTVRFA